MQNLLCFAHRGEAQSFFKSFSLKPLASDKLSGAYVGQEFYLLITGEGALNAASKLTYFLGLYAGQIGRVINLGIAGALSEQVKLGEIYPIRTCYAQNEFKSFSTLHTEAPIDCITSKERVLNSLQAKQLSAFACVVDREAWGFGLATQTANLELEVYKIISDRAGKQTDCFAIKDKALEWSQKLLRFYLEHLQTVDEKKEEAFLLPAEFHLSVTQRRQLLKLLGQFQKVPQDWIKQIARKDIPPKERTKRLIERLQKHLYPWYQAWQDDVKQKTQKLHQSMIQTQVNPEDPQGFLNLNFKVKDLIDWNDKLQKLEDFDFKALEKSVKQDV